jgi:outer membrane protein OmpA-like peptidoglycan-associated protein
MKSIFHSLIVKNFYSNLEFLMNMKIKFRIILLLIFSFTINLTAQKQGQDLVDSLLAELPKTIDDTNKVNLLAEIAFNLNFLSPESGLEYAKQGLDLAKQLNWKAGIAKNYNALMQNYWGIGDFDMAIDMYNAAVKIEEELGVFRKKEEVKLTSINRTFTYPTSDYTNLTPEIRKFLNDVAVYMKENPEIVISIIGHSDNFGTFEQNDFRAKDRAQKVADYLVNNGISRRRLLASGKGSLDPVAKNDTEEGRRKNRRVVIRAIGQ